MKIVTASNGKQTVKMSKTEWQQIGKKAGWMKVAQAVDTMEQDTAEQDTAKQDRMIKLLESIGFKIITMTPDFGDENSTDPKVCMRGRTKDNKKIIVEVDRDGHIDGIEDYRALEQSVKEMEGFKGTNEFRSKPGPSYYD